MTIEVARLPVEKLVREDARSTGAPARESVGRTAASGTGGSRAVDAAGTGGPRAADTKHSSFSNQQSEFSNSSTETSAMIKARVMAARALQAQRQGTVTNAALSSKQVKRHCALDEPCLALLTRAVERLGLSARAYERIRKVARTIADLDQSEHIQVPHLAEAIQYRSGEERLRG